LSISPFYLGYLDIFTGLSGDLFLGVLVDAGCPLEVMREAVGGLPVEFAAEEVRRGGLRGTLVRVTGPTEGPHHRSYAELAEILEGLALPEGQRERAGAVLLRLAEAEGAVHGVPVEGVHFHELGGLDTIADLVGTVAGLAHLGIERLVCSAIPLSHGYIETAHGRLPVPPPAVMQLVEGAATRPVDIEGETVTPTGAALALTLGKQGAPPAMTIKRVAYGAGQRDFPEAPNLVRLTIGEGAAEAHPPAPLPKQEGGEASPLPTDELVVLETNVDDMNPELQPALLAALFSAGALDAWLTPIVMKKGRPAVMVSALAAPERAEGVVRAFLEQSTTFGVRVLPCTRRCLPREMRSVETAWGPVAVKVGLREGRVVTASPEYEDCARLAAQAGVAARRVYAAALGKAEEMVGL
jgi:uncharacterized protein (TIGR00299 family) protein